MSAFVYTNDYIKYNSFYGSGEFDYIDSYMQCKFKNVHWSLNQCELWDWVKTFEYDNIHSFEFIRLYSTLSNREIIPISELVNILHEMKYISLYGYDNHKQNYYYANYSKK